MLSLRSTPLAALLPLLFFALATTDPTAQQLPNGGSVDGSISTSGGVDTFTFSAQAGHTFLVRLVDRDRGVFFPVLTVEDPAGNTFGSDGDGTVASVGGSAPLTGTYRVRVRDGNTTPRTGNYRVYYSKAPGANEGGRLPNGRAVAGSIGVGDLDSFTFRIEAGERYFLRFTDVDGTVLFPVLRLYDPRGAAVGVDGDGSVASLGGAAPTSGVYTVILSDGNSSPSGTGNYRVQLARFPGASSGGALTSGTITPGRLDRGELDTFTFRIDAGERYQLRLSDTDGTAMFPVLRLYDPQGRFVASDGDSTVASLGGMALFTGDYTVLIADGNSSPSGTGRYNMHFARIPGLTSEGTVRSGRTASGRIERGEIDTFDLQLTAGESYQLRAADVDGTNLFLVMQLFDPRGDVAGSDGDSTVAALGGVAAFTGRYTVMLTDGNSSPAATGDYRLYYANLPGEVSSGPLRNGGTVSGTLERGELESYTFEMEAGQNYVVRFVDVAQTLMFPVLRLYDPRGTFLSSDGGSAVAGVGGAAPFTGTYRVVLSDGNSSPSATGDFEVHLTVAPGANEHGYLLDGVPAQGDIEVGDLDSYTFLARAGDAVQIRMVDTTSSLLFPSFNVYSPTGQRLFVTGSSTTTVRNFTAPLDGTYTIVTYDGNSTAAATGPYTLEVGGTGRLGNSGCDREGTVVLSGETSAATGFAIAAPDFTRTCSGSPFVAVGPCNPRPLLLPDGLSCGICGLTVVQAFALEASPLVIPPLSSTAVGTTVCAQALCVTTDSACLTLSAASEITITQ